MWSFSERGLYWVRTTTFDDPVLPAERDRRLRADRREDRQALTLTAGEDHRHRPLHAGMLTLPLHATRDRTVKVSLP
jgi:hypothetical protein